MAARLSVCLSVHPMACMCPPSGTKWGPAKSLTASAGAGRQHGHQGQRAVGAHNTTEVAASQMMVADGVVGHHHLQNSQPVATRALN